MGKARIEKNATIQEVYDWKTEKWLPYAPKEKENLWKKIKKLLEKGIDKMSRV